MGKISLNFKFWKKKRQLAIFILSTLLTFLTVVTVYLNWALIRKISGQSFVSPLAINGSQTADTTPRPTINLTGQIKSLGILFVGYGGAGHDGGYLTDAIQLLYLDFEKKKLVLISIPRDLWVKMPQGRETKINGAFISAAGSNKGTKETKSIMQNGAVTTKNLISQITGLGIDYFVSVDFVGFMRTIGLELKGIDVEVSETLDDLWYPISGEELNLCDFTPEEMTELHQKYSGFELEKQFTCRYEHLHFDKGLVHMEGGDALKYVRSRHGSAEGDVSRGKRQQEVILAIEKKLFTFEHLDDVPKIYQQFMKNLDSDLDLEAAKFLVPILRTTGDFQVIRINLSPKNVLVNSSSSAGGAIMLPQEGLNKWGKIQAYIEKQLAEK